MSSPKFDVDEISRRLYEGKRISSEKILLCGLAFVEFDFEYWRAFPEEPKVK